MRYISTFLLLIIIIFLSIIIDKYNYSRILRQKYKKDKDKKIYKIMKDKLLSKKLAKENGFNIPITYKIYENISEIDSINNKVLKPNNLSDSRGVFVIKNNVDLLSNKKIDLNTAKEQLSKLVSENIINGKNIDTTKYFTEEIILNNGKLPDDYKFYVIDGKVKIIAVTYNRQFKNNKVQFSVTWFTPKWNMVMIPCLNKNYKFNYIKKPNCIDECIKLCENFIKKVKIDCRIDLFIDRDKIFFGEFTPLPGLGQHTLFGNIILGIPIKYGQ